MAENIGYAALPVILSFQGAEGQIAKGLGVPLQSAAKKAGRDAGQSIADGLSAAKAKVEKASTLLSNVRRKEADAAGKVRVAEAQLQSLRDRGITDAGRLAGAEEKVASARRNAAAAVNTQKNAAGALANAQKQAEQAAQAASSETANQARNVSLLGQAAGRTEGSMRLLATTAKLAGVAGGGALLADQVKKSITVGMDYEKSLNTMQAVSGANLASMAEVQKKARELGNAADLPNTSARDAADAMTELAKGGLSVDQSMKAAKGTLQLAAAASVDAGQAATIQARALQTFGKDGAFAAKAADIFANASNASTAEITDVAAAMQQGGLVANQFGLSMEDTAATIALLANNGVQGSDAGTLLKSTLLALTDQGKPAQAAIEELGLRIYDAQGKFVGMHSLMEQLGEAAGRMTEEQYQAATATLFGSDAMRLAGVGGKEGAKGFDLMRVAIDRAGAAADVAKAKTQGLPGAWARFQNMLEEGQLKLYDLIKGPASQALDALTDAPERLGKLFSSDLMRGGETASALKSIMDSAREAAPSMLTLAKTAAQAAGAFGVGAWNVAVTGLQALAAVLNVVEPLLSTVAGLVRDNQTAATGLLAAYMAYKTIPGVLSGWRNGLQGITVEGGRMATAANSAGRGAQALGASFDGMRSKVTGTVTALGAARTSVGTFGSAYRDSVRWMQQGNPAMSTTGAHLRTIGSMAGGTAASGLNSLKGAASGAIGLLGGPWGAALAVAGIAGTAWASTVQQQKQVTDQLNESLRGVAETQKGTFSKLITSRGAVTGEVYADLTKQVDGYRQSVELAAKNDAKWTDEAKDIFGDVFGGGQWFDNARVHRLDEAAGRAQVTKKALDELGVTSEDLGKRLGSTDGEWNSFVAKLRASGDGGRLAADGLGEMRAKFVEQQGQAQKLAPGITQLGDAMRVMGDKTASAGDKMSALKAAMDAMNPARSKVEAVAQFGEAVKKAAESTGQLGPVAFDSTGALDGMNVNSANLARTLADLADKAGQVASAGGDMNVVNAQLEERFKAIAAATGEPIEKIRQMYSELGGRTVELAVKLNGLPETVQGLGKVKATFDAVPGQKTVNVASSEVSEKTRKLLEDMKFKVETLPGGKTVEITATSDAALAQLKAVMGAVTGLPKGTAIKVDAPGGQSVLGLLENLKIKATEGNNKTIEVEAPNAPGVLEKLNALGLAVRSDNGKTILITEQGADDVAQKIKVLTDPATKVITITYEGSGPVDTSSSTVNQRRAAAGLPPLTNANGSITSFGDGGVSGFLPNRAVVQPGRGRGLFQWAEGETGRESFIPWALSKRKRSTMILSETARAFGLQLVDARNPFRQFKDGGITVEDVKNFASGITSGQYSWAGAPTSWNTDCSGAQSRVANFITGFTGRFATGSQAEQLAKRGFINGDPPAGQAAYVIGWVNGGPGGGHTAGTIIDADGTRTNVEMGGKSGNGGFGAGAAGADEFPNRAWISLQGQGGTDSGTGDAPTLSDAASSAGSSAGSLSSGGGMTGGSSSGGSGGGVQKYSLGWWLGRALFGDVPGVFGSPDSSGSSLKETADNAKKPVDPKKLREAKDKADDAEMKAAVARQKLAEVEGNPKSKDSAKQTARNALSKAERDAEQAKTDYAALQTSSTSTLSDARSKADTAEKTAAAAREKLAKMEADPKVAESAKLAQRNKVQMLEREAEQAKSGLASVKAGSKSNGDESEMSAALSPLKDLTKILGGGVLETFGMDGSWLPNLADLGIVKMANAIMGIKFTPPPWMEGKEAPPPWIGGVTSVPAPASVEGTPTGPGMQLPLMGGGAPNIDQSVHVNGVQNNDDLVKKTRRAVYEPQKTRLAGAVPVGR